MALSVISVKKSVRQYHCRPAGYSGSNAPCSALNGISISPTTSGLPNDLMGSRTLSAWACGPV